MDKLNLDLAAVDAPADIEPPTLADRMLHAALGRMTSGVSPAALALAWMDRARDNVEYVDAGYHVMG
jgi:polyhydroxyalkanoate synthase